MRAVYLAPPADAGPPGVVLAQAGRVNETFAPWLVSDGRALPLRQSAQQWPCTRVASVTELVERWDRYRLDLQALLEMPTTRERIAQDGIPIGALRLQAPIRPGQVFCTIGNYRRQVVETAVDAGSPEDAHARRTAALETLAKRRCDGDPYVCLTSPDRVGSPIGALVLGPGVDTRDRCRHRRFRLPPDPGAGRWDRRRLLRGQRPDHPRPCRPPDLPALGSDWLQSKGMRGSLPLGPWFVPAWQIPDPTRLWLRLTLNGAVMQDDTAGDMVFDIGEQLAYLSRHTRLRPGDLLCTGSPAGFGIHHGRFLRPGDVIRASITGLGGQVKHCVEQTRPTAADPRRTPQMEPTP